MKMLLPWQNKNIHFSKPFYGIMFVLVYLATMETEEQFEVYIWHIYSVGYYIFLVFYLTSRNMLLCVTMRTREI